MKENYQNKKAQGALEFLMTYGWAFLVILIMIGALAYFGVLSPTKFLPERCTFGSQFLCKDYLILYNEGAGTVTYPANVTLRLQNNLGQAIYVSTVDATSPEGFGGCTAITVTDADGSVVYDSMTPPTAPASISDGAYFNVGISSCTSLGGMTKGSKYKISIPVTYYAATSSSSFTHTIDGEIFANVEKGVTSAP